MAVPERTLIRVERRGNVGVVTLDGPHRHNALSTTSLSELADALDELDFDAHIHCVVLTGAGGTYCAGGDLKELAHTSSLREMDDFHRRFKIGVTQRIERMRPPVIAAIEGACVGGGFEIALAADIRVASETAYFGDAEVRYGLVGSFQRLARIAPTLARYMLLTGTFVDATTAMQNGLLSEVAPASTALSRALEVAEKIATQPREAVTALKLLLNFGTSWDTTSGDSMEGALVIQAAASTGFRDRLAKFS
jgi:enoyl-CoA hydratase/carnithine racemase